MNMNSNVFFLFWKKFSKNLLIGLSLLMLVFGLTYSSGKIFDQGPTATFAQEADEFISTIDDSFEPVADTYVTPVDEPVAYDSYADTYFTPIENTSSDPVADVYVTPIESQSDPVADVYVNPIDYGTTTPTYGEPYNPYTPSTNTNTYTPSYTSSTNSQSSSYEGPGCDGSHSVWGEWSSDGRLLRVEADYGAQAGECNNGSGSSNTSYGTTTTSNSGTWEFKYPECDWSSRQVYDVYQNTATGAYDRRNPHYQEDVCGRNQTWEGPGCNGSHSVWGIFSADGSKLMSVEKDYGVKPGECNNSYSSTTTYTNTTPTYSNVVSYDDRIECDGGDQVTRRYYTNGQKAQIVSRYGRIAGYCGVGYQTSYTPTYNPAPYQGTGGYYAPYPVATGTYTVPTGVNVPVTNISNGLVPMQISCSADSTMVQRGGTVTYYANSIIGGSGAVNRYVFSGEGSQSSNSPYFTKGYPTSGVKHMRLTIYDADSRVSPQTTDCPVISVYEPTQTQNTPYPGSFQGGGGYYAPYPNTAPPPFQGAGGYYGVSSSAYYAPASAITPPPYQGTGGYYAAYPAAAPAPYQGNGGYYAQYQASAPAPYQGTGGYYAVTPAVAPTPYQGTSGYQGTGGYYAQYPDQTPVIATPTQSQVAGPSNVTAQAKSINISNSSYQPGNISINKGESVTWTNNDSMAHTVTSDNNSWTSQTLQPGQSLTISFPNSGNYAYHCELHPGMKGTVSVATAATAASVSNNSSVNVVLSAANAGDQQATSAATPKVAYTADPGVTELPKTGLPLAAWAVSALLPLGVKMRKGKKTEESEQLKAISANSIWLEREMNK